MTGKRKAPVSSGVAELPDGPPDASGLTPRQQRVLTVIRDSIDRRGYPPSMREIGERVGLTSSSSVAHQLRVLQEKGFLKRDPNRPRAVEVKVPAPAREEPDDVTGQGDARPAPAYVLTPGSDILAENPEGLALLSGLEEWPRSRRNFVRYVFRHPAAGTLIVSWRRMPTRRWSRHCGMSFAS